MQKCMEAFSCALTVELDASMWPPEFSASSTTTLIRRTAPILRCTGHTQKASLLDCVHGSTGSSGHKALLLHQLTPLLSSPSSSASVGSKYECKSYVATCCCDLVGLQRCAAPLFEWYGALQEIATLAATRRLAGAAIACSDQQAVTCASATTGRTGIAWSLLRSRMEAHPCGNAILVQSPAAGLLRPVGLASARFRAEIHVDPIVGARCQTMHPFQQSTSAHRLHMPIPQETHPPSVCGLF